MRIAAAFLACSLLPASPQVATFYFYWYRWPDEHFPAGKPPGPHFHHFVDQEKVSYADPGWHAGEFRDMAACGIDIALPVYWGAPGAYDHPHLRFANAGLAPMVEALARLARRGEPGVRLGLFYDTTSLLCDVRGVEPRGGKPDLRTESGKELFQETVLGYFARIPKDLWGRVAGRALVVLYSSEHAGAWDASLGAGLRAAFAQRFPGEGVFLVADRSWGEIGQDGTTAWGAALHGPSLFKGVAQIGPGGDDSLVPDRFGPIRDREDGGYYRWSWRKAIATRPRLVLIETWNEMHEGTAICATREFGRAYLDLTREYAGRLRAGDPGPAVTLRHRDPHLPPIPSRASAERLARGTTPDREVFADYGGAEPVRIGLREVAWRDGPVRVVGGSLRPHRASPDGTHVYFAIEDSFRCDVEADLRVLVDLEPFAARGIEIEYDAHPPRDATATTSRPADRYTRAVRRAAVETPRVQRLVFDLPRARCANRQNGGADFRLCIDEVRTVILRISVRVPEDEGR